jgi:invasion protein IalB
LGEGIAYRHADDASRAVPLTWQMCNAQTCLAQARITVRETERLRRGDAIILAFRPLRDSRIIQVSASLTGVTRGLAAVQACGKRKTASF